MKNTVKQSMQAGFTLIELIIVIAVVAILAVLAIGKFADIRKDAARKTNVANIKNISRTINTEIARLEMNDTTKKGMFAYVESLIDSQVGGGDVLGSEGTYDTNGGKSWYDGQGNTIPGIYCGIKTTTTVQNAAGVGTSDVADIADAHDNNVGLTSLASPTTARGKTTPAKLCMYYLTASDVSALNEAGVNIVTRHNYSNGQASSVLASGATEIQQKGLHTTGGGPGQRADLSAYYPVILTNGSAVAVLNPAACESIYRDLGLSYASTYQKTGLDANNPNSYFTNNICCKVYAFGLGRDTEVTTKLFENAPRCPTLDKTHYRNYILLFNQASGFGNSGSGIKFLGVIDPEGNTVKGAQYNADWSS